MAKVYWTDKDAIAVADLASDNVTLSGPTAGTLSMHCSRHDSPFVGADAGATNSNSIRIETGMQESPVIPPEYHEALTYKAIAHGYEKDPGGLEQAQYFHNKFNQAVADGKRESNTHKAEEGSVVIQGRDF
tara:strand:- start:736 stop:1128 length:393 start_codon:yes stop_codon:yes gene_type:complete